MEARMPAAPSRRLAIAAGATMVVVVLAGAGSGPAAAAVKPPPSAATALRSLVSQTVALPRSSVATARRAKLLRIARHARRVAASAPCSSVRDLTSYRKTLKITTLKRTVKRSQRARLLARLARLNAASTSASRSLLASKQTKRCGGGVTPSTLSQTKAAVLRSDENGMIVRVGLPQLQFVSASGGGRTYTRLAAPGAESPGAPGTPGIPAASETFAVPDGAKVAVQSGNAESQTIDGVEVYPVQPDPVDQAGGQAPAPNFFAGPFKAPPFTLDRNAYADGGYSDGPSAKVLGQARDLNIGGLVVPLAQYDPVKDKLKIFTSIDVKITFEGGPKTISDAIGSPWETAQRRTAGGLLNANVVRKLDRQIIYQPCGEELLVITNPSTLASANTYATARRAAGFLTRVAQTGTAAVGTTATSIQAYIRSQVNHPFCIRPSYVTFIGDDELVPTFTTGPGGIPSDNPYSTKNDADELPDLAVGRILGNDAAQIDAELAKIIHYETSPPTGPMLNKAIVAAQFQDVDGEGQVNDGQENRTFVQFAETARNGLTARGVAVDRIYTDNPTTNPTKFNDGTPLPAALQKPTFAWDGDGADVSAAWNQGRFMVIHRDHGWSDGWGDPTFTTAEVDALTNTNDNLPVVLSINCASAQYDTDETSFVQNALVKPTGGAVGAFGDTRNSPTWHNSQIALGFLDAMLPTVLAGEGPGSQQRMGDALVHGKLRLAGLAPPSGPGIAGGDGDTRAELYLWHYFGDPTMQLWGGGSAPIVLNPAVFKAVYKELPIPNPGDPPPFYVEVTLPAALAGQPISLLRNGQVIGKALAGDGSVAIAATFNDGAPKPGELSIALEADGVAPLQVPVDGVPPKPTALTQSCPQNVTVDAKTVSGPVTVSGTLPGVPEGATVTVTFQAPGPNGGPGGHTYVRDVTTDSGGAWSATATAVRADLGTWSVSSAYAGGDGFAGSSAGPCTFTVSLAPN
jgi:hypothetical protein